jgi:hypothetical protein
MNTNEFVRMLEELNSDKVEPSHFIELAKKVQEVEKVQEKILATMQSMVSTLNETRQKSENSQVIVSSMLRTIADGRPLESSQLRESHHVLIAERVNKIFNSAVDSGIIERVDTIVSDSIVLVQEFDASGMELNRTSEFSMSNIDAEFKDLFLTKNIGDRVALFKDGQLKNTFIIQDIFKPLEKVEKNFNAETTSTETTTDTETTSS